MQSFSSRRGLVRPLRFKPRQRWFWGCPARASAWWDNVLADMAIMPDIRHLQISYNTPCLSPNFCITFVFHFSWVLQPSQEKLKTMFMQRFFFWRGGERGRGKGKQGALWEICKCRMITWDQAQFSLTCSRSLFVSPCLPECNFKAKRKQSLISGYANG